jgi:hypothetical protein
VIAFSGENFIIFLGSFEANSISFLGSNKERRAVDEIIHDILKLWL